MNAVALAPAALAIFFLANVAQADLFQFIRQSTGSYVSLAPVFINGNFIGSTDQHGRIDIQIPPGQYQLTIRLRQDIYDIDNLHHWKYSPTGSVFLKDSLIEK